MVVYPASLASNSAKSSFDVLTFREPSAKNLEVRVSVASCSFAGSRATSLAVAAEARGRPGGCGAGGASEGGAKQATVPVAAFPSRCRCWIRGTGNLAFIEVDAIDEAKVVDGRAPTSGTGNPEQRGPVAENEDTEVSLGGKQSVALFGGIESFGKQSMALTVGVIEDAENEDTEVVGKQSVALAVVVVEDVENEDTESPHKIGTASKDRGLGWHFTASVARSRLLPLAPSAGRSLGPEITGATLGPRTSARGGSPRACGSGSATSRAESNDVSSRRAG